MERKRANGIINLPLADRLCRYGKGGNYGSGSSANQERLLLHRTEYEDRYRRRKTKWIATGIPEGGKKNLKQAEELLAKTRYTYEDMVIHTEPKSKTTVASDILFADYMIKWLSIIKNSVEVDTYAGYVNNVKKRIAPYFRELGVTLKSVTALDIENFYSYCFNELKLKGTTIQRFHANIHKAMKYAVKA